jgi:NAD(P)-dependent dehydrogenase (short-subunit alcohol dehydrogenase family)
MRRLIGNTIFVTGAGQGVGEAVAKRLVAEGANRATLVGRRSAPLEKVANDLRAQGCEVLIATGDLSKVADCKRVVEEAQAAFGPIEIMCNCAGATDRGTIFDMSEDAFDRIFQTNVRSTFFTMQTALPAMVERRKGVVINISSMLAYGGVPHLAAYSASKAALNTLTRNVANTVRHDRVRVHAINLGWTVTPAEHQVQTQVHHLSEDWAEREGAKQPFGRLLNAADPAALCAFLSSEEAEMMTGTVIDLEQWVIGTLDAR